MALEVERETYRRILPDLLADPANVGRYVIIRGEAVGGVYPTVETAAEAACDRYGLEPFMLKKVVEKEEPLFFSRNLTRH